MAKRKTKKELAWEAMLVQQIPWANRQALHVLRAAPTCGLTLEDVQAVAWHACYRSITKFDPKVGAPFEQFALRYVQQMVWTQVRKALLKRIKHSDYVANYQPARPDPVLDICMVDSPLAIECQWLPPAEREAVNLMLQGRPQREPMALEAALFRLREGLLDRGFQSVGELLESDV